MIAADIGEGAGRDMHAVEPALIEPVRGGLERQMGHTLARERIELAVQRHWIGRGQRAVHLAPRRDQPDGADARSRVPEPRPDLACEGGDRRLAARAGDRGDDLRLGGKELGGGAREAGPRVLNLHEGDAGRKRRLRHALRHDRGSARRQCGADMAQAVVLGARHRHEQVAGLDGAAVGAHAAELERGEARVADGIHGEQALELHGEEWRE